jgi:hypothetical protein
MINNYLVQVSTANHDNVINQLVRYEINSFPIQNQASHLTSYPPEKFAFNRSCLPLRNRFYNDYNSSGSTVTMEESSQHEKGRVSGGLRVYRTGTSFAELQQCCSVALQAVSSRQAWTLPESPVHSMMSAKVHGFLNSPLLLARLDHVASLIVNANHSMMCCDALRTRLRCWLPRTTSDRTAADRKSDGHRDDLYGAALRKRVQALTKHSVTAPNKNQQPKRGRYNEAEIYYPSTIHGGIANLPENSSVRPAKASGVYLFMWPHFVNVRVRCALIRRFWLSRRIECLACGHDPREREHHLVGAYRPFPSIAGTCKSAFSPLRSTR